MLARVAFKKITRRTCTRFSLPGVQTASKSTISGEEYLAQSKEPYTVRQNAKGRFVSPHVDIYDFPLAAISSVLTRFTGMGMVAGFYGASMYALVGGDVIALMDAYKVAVHPAVLAATKFTVGFPIAYHYLAGLRHMYVDRNPGELNSDTILNSSRVCEVLSMVQLKCSSILF